MNVVASGIPNPGIARRHTLDDVDFGVTLVHQFARLFADRNGDSSALVGDTGLVELCQKARIRSPTCCWPDRPVPAWPRRLRRRSSRTLQAFASLHPRTDWHLVAVVLRPYSSVRTATSMFSVELPGIETDALPGNMPSELPVRSISFRFSPARYLRFRSRVLMASRAVSPIFSLSGASQYSRKASPSGHHVRRDSGVG